MRFQDDDIVRISKHSVFYGDGRWNPVDIEGRIEAISTSFGGNQIVVIWDNEECNAYEEDDLRLVRRG